jgi:PA14 domain/Chitobiase/beta-hexosaminidase C-terminal domain
MDVNGQAIHGTTASPFDALAWGRCTQKQHGTGTTLYLHVFDWPSSGRLEVPGLGNKIVGAWLLDDPGHLLTLSGDDGHVFIRVPERAPDSIASVIAVEIDGVPIVYSAPTITSPSKILVREVDVTLGTKSSELGVRYTLDGSDPIASSAEYTEPVRITRTTTIKARTFQGSKPVSATISETFTKVTPAPAAKADGLVDGLTCEYAQGDWDKLPDFDALANKTTSPATKISLGAHSKEERFGLRFKGYVEIPNDNVYTFALMSDDGSRMLVDGKLAIDNDGLHSSAEKRASLALAAGPHAIQVEYFNKTGQSDLELNLALAGSTLVPVPASVLKHRP